MFWRVKCYRIFIISINVVSFMFICLCVCILFISGQRLETQTDRVTRRACGSQAAVGLKVIVCVGSMDLCVVSYYIPHSLLCRRDLDAARRSGVTSAWPSWRSSSTSSTTSTSRWTAGAANMLGKNAPTELWVLVLSLLVFVCVCVHPPWVHEKEREEVEERKYIFVKPALKSDPKLPSYLNI